MMSVVTFARGGSVPSLLIRAEALDAAACECRRAGVSDGVDAFGVVTVPSGSVCGDEGCATLLAEVTAFFRAAGAGVSDGCIAAVSTLAGVAAEFERLDGEIAAVAAGAIQ